MKNKPCVFFIALFFALSIVVLANAQGGSNRWIDDFNYADVQQLQDAGWTVTHAAGASLQSGSVVLDGTEADTVIDCHNHFQFAVSDWKVESKGAWMGQGHSVLSVKAFTERHSYVWFLDGYYNQFAFYRDDKQISRFGVYTETPNSWVTLSLVKNGNSVSMYYNGHLEYTYTEEDGQPSVLTGVELISPWRGDAKYDYVMVGDPTATYSPEGTSPPDTSGSGFPTSAVLIGGGIAALVVGGVVVYYFFVAGGGSAGASTGAGAGSGSGLALGGSGGGTGTGAGQGANAGNAAGEEDEGHMSLHNPPEANYYQDQAQGHAEAESQTQYQDEAQGDAEADYYQDQVQGQAEAGAQAQPNPYEQAQGDAQAQYQDQAQGYAEADAQAQYHDQAQGQAEANYYQDQAQGQAEADAQTQYQQERKASAKTGTKSRQDNQKGTSDGANP